jgi:NAD(P)H-dependent flavin oxidoreductase YrpB (nitropropane dioxygenase family)
MVRDPLHTKLCDMLGVEFPIVAFTHCKDVAAAVINAGAFAVYGGTPHDPDELAADIKWIRERIEGRLFGLDLVFPASVPSAGTIEDLKAQIPEDNRRFVEQIKKKYNIPEPKNPVYAYSLGWLTTERSRQQLDVALEERVPVLASGLGSPAFVVEAAHSESLG